MGLTCAPQHEISRHRSMSDLRRSSRVKDNNRAHWSECPPVERPEQFQPTTQDTRGVF
jgi:hypothetical protein